MNKTGPRRILIIDPDPESGRLMNLMLSRKYGDGTQVVLTRDAGWAALQAEPADLVFGYLREEGVTATGFCRRLRSSPKLEHVPVVVVGAMQPEDIYAELQEAGASCYLFVPLAPKKVLAARDAALRGETYYP